MSTSTRTTTVPPCSTSTLLTVLKAARATHITPLLWGPPGVGKSSLIRSLAADEGVPCEVVIGSLREPSDFAGLPVITEHGVRMEPPAWARRLAAAEHGAYLLLDELSTAPPAVQAAMLATTLDRTVGDLTLPRSVAVIAAANPPDSAADGWDLTPPLANRLLHITHNPSPDAWIAGMTAGFTNPAPRRVNEPTKARRDVSRGMVAAFIRTRPDLLDDMPTNPTSTGHAWPSRRTWTMTADILAALEPHDTDAAHLATTGLIGPGAAAEYLTWRTNADLPNPEDVTADPTTINWADLPPDRAWAILTAVVAHATGLGTQDAWRAAWTPLATATHHGLGDVAAAQARTLLTARPTNTKPPKAARAFTDLLTTAGLLN